MKLRKVRRQRLSKRKLRELVLYISRGSEGDVFFGAVKLNKLLFLADFFAYRTYGRSITGAEHEKLEHGPAPRKLKPLLQWMERRKLIAVRPIELGGYTQKRTLALREPDLSKFSAEEIALVDHLIRRFWDRSASEMSDISHRLRGWQLAKVGEIIPYSVALVGNRDPTERERTYGLRLEAEARACLAL